MKPDVWSYKAVNTRTGEICTHTHHSKESAERCALLEGWTRYKVKRMPSRPTYDHLRTPRKARWKALQMAKDLTMEGKE